MGIYIEGMEMPTSCKDCGLKVNCDACEGRECVCVPLHKTIGYYDDLLSGKRRDDCPLINVPPHGDLIDRNALMSRVTDEKGNYYGHDCAVIGEAAESAPTIIPASDD